MLIHTPDVPDSQAQGFFQQQAQAGFCYSAAMALYFLAVVRYGITESKIAKIEKVFHVVTFVVLESFAVTLLFFDAYNPMWFSELGCWFGPWPLACDVNTEDCERGQHYLWHAYFGAISFQVAAFLIISVSNILIFRTFRNQELQMRRYASGGENNISREIAIQGFLYSGAALNSVFWGFLSLYMSTVEKLSTEVLLFFSLMVRTSTS
jgi:hypothetical protein